MVGSFRFPQNHLGKLMGLAALIGAMFSLLQYPLFIAMEVLFEGRTIEVCCIVATFLHSISYYLFKMNQL